MTPTPPSTISSTEGRSPEEQFRVVRRRNRVPLSCYPCRTKKKCDRGRPCSNCTKREGMATSSCSYASPSARKKSQGQGDSSPDDMQNRIDRLEGLVLSLMHNGANVDPATSRVNASASHSMVDSGSSAKTGQEEAALVDDDSDVDDGLAASLGVLKVDTDKGKSMYIGQQHWHLILADIAEVKNYFTSHKKELETSYERVKSSQSISAREGPTLLLGASPASDIELRAVLPPKSSVMALCDRYFNSMEYTASIIHGPTFLQQLETHWEDPSKTPIMWLGLLYSILCLAMLNYHKVGDEPPEWKGRTFDLASEFRLRTVQCLTQGDYTKPTEYTVETMIHYVFGECSSRWDADLGLWLIVSLTTRIAFRMGYHRDAKWFPSLTPFQAEMRRRTWALVRMADVLFSNLVSLPSMISEHDCDTQLPNNLFDEDFHPGIQQLPPSRPNTEPTPISYMIAKARLGNELGNILQATSRLGRNVPYDEIIRFDAKLRQVMQELPPHLKLGPLGESREALTLIVARYTLDILYQRILCVLHRKYLPRARQNPRYAHSRRSAIEASLQAMGHLQTLHRESQDGGRLRGVGWYVKSIATKEFILRGNYQVVLYCALILILSVVLSRFILALVFQWFISRHYAASKTSQTSDRRKRNQQIEDWSEDIYRAPARLPGDVDSTAVGSERGTKRSSSFLPTTSRFSTVNGAERNTGQRRMPTTMTSQGTSSLLYNPNSSLYRQPNDSRASFLRSDTYGSSSMPEGPGPAGFIHDAVVPQPPSDWMPFDFPLAHSMCLVTAYSEGAEGIRTTLDSIATTDYPSSHKCIVICDGIIKGKGEAVSTPDVCLGMLRDHSTPPDVVQHFSYVAVASGSKRHNMAKVYCGFYDYGTQSQIPVDRQQRVPMMVIVKCGTPDEAAKSKPGNRGKRDSQIILMSFLQKVMFDERMTELEYEMFNGLWKVTGISPDYYEIVLMVDADTKVFPDSLTHMVSAMVKDPEIMGLCGETKIANKRDSWVTAIQVFEYFVSHHLAKSFESVFGGVTCLPGCFCMYRIKAPKGGQNYWVPILANPDIVEHYSENVVETLHEKNLYLLGEYRFLTTLMLRTFPKRKQVFVPQAVCKTTVPDKFMVLLSQRRRWINSTIHNLMELVLVRDLCGTFCFSMQFVIFVELVGTLVLPAAIAFTFYVVITSIVHSPPQIIPLVLLALILGLPGLLIVTAHSWSYVVWMLIYLLSLPIWNFVLPTYAFWKFDDFSWGDTRKTAGEKSKKGGHETQGEFDSSKITMKRWAEFEREKRFKYTYWGSRENIVGNGWATAPGPYHNDEHHLDA